MKKFQKANKLSVTGVVDQATYKKLKEEYAKLQEDDDDSSDPNPTVPRETTVETIPAITAGMEMIPEILEM